MTCKHMIEVERIVKDIDRQYSIQLDSEYTERIKRIICGAVCAGRCRPENMILHEEAGKCPICGTKLNYYCPDVKPDLSKMDSMPWRCTVCGSTGREKYDLVFRAHIEVKHPT